MTPARHSYSGSLISCKQFFRRIADLTASSSFSDIGIEHLSEALSEARLGTYVAAANGDREKALALYQRNLQVSAAFLLPLHLFEISLRNAIAEAIASRYGTDWVNSERFSRSLQGTGPGYRPRQDLENCVAERPAPGAVISSLKFVFWEKMLVSAHHEQIWRSEFFQSFPNAPQMDGSEGCRERLQRITENILLLRNRIAHHEPVFRRNLDRDLSKAIDSIRWRSIAVAN